MSTQTTNKLRSTMVYGTFGNVDKTDGTINKASGVFQRNLLVGENLILGTETLILPVTLLTRRAISCLL